MGSAFFLIRNVGVQSHKVSSLFFSAVAQAGSNLANM